MKQPDRIQTLLKRFQLRRTPTRVAILKLYTDRDYALAHRDIEKTLSEQFDRVTIYRTLHTFEESGLIHRVYDDSAAVKYALCGDECTHHEKHEHNHVHFTCSNCEKTFCIENTPVDYPILPAGFTTESVHLFVKGICKKCSVL